MHYRTKLRSAVFAAVTCGTLLGAWGAPATAVSPMAAVPRNLSNAQVLLTAETDVTGDREKDKIWLLGERSGESNKALYHNLYLVVEDAKAPEPNGENEAMISVRGGYVPKMKLCDFNGDRVTDILVSVRTDEKTGASDYYIYSFKDNKPATVPAPPVIQVSGRFADHYKAELTVDGRQTFTVDLRGRKTLYDQMGVYRDGSLERQVAVMPGPYSMLSPTDIDQNGSCELHGVQRIGGVSELDTIAFIQSIWSWDNGQWRLVKVDARQAAG